MAEPTEAADPPALTTQLPEEAASVEEAPMEPVEPEDVHVALMVDASNGFNELGRKAMLWTVRATQMGCRLSVYIQQLPALCHAHSALPRKILLHPSFQRRGDTG